jgi:hypothetical protein
MRRECPIELTKVLSERTQPVRKQQVAVGYYSDMPRLILALISISLAVADGGDGRARLQLIGERNLSALIHEPPGAEPHSHSISQLKISDDDRWIAVDLVAGHYDGRRHDVQHHHLLLLPADLKTNATHQLEFDTRSAVGSSFFLSSDASVLVIENGPDIRVDNRRSNSSCSVFSGSEVLDLGGFINAELFVVSRYNHVSRDSSNEIARYELYDSGCKLRDSSESPGTGKATASPEKGRMFLRYFVGTHWETELLDWPSWKVVKRWPFWEDGLAGDNGRVLCFESYSGSLNSPVQCRDLSNGAILSKQVVIHDGDPLAVAADGTLAVGNDWFALWKPFTEGEYWAHVKRQVLWDFRSGEVLGSWVPKLQLDNAGKWKGGGYTIERVPFICALSRTGTFILEGGDETIRLSRVTVR